MSRLAGACVRALLVAILVATPSLLLPYVSEDTAQAITLLALGAAGFVIFEYASSYPSLVEFRDAPPFNRIRFLSLFVTVFVLSVVWRGEMMPSGLTLFVKAIGIFLGELLDFPYSPVRLVLLALPETATPVQVQHVKTAAGLAYSIAMFSLALFYLILKLAGWPSRSGAFNVWINLPNFDPTAGGDVVARLNRDARVNVALGFLLPFLMPAVALAAARVFGPPALDAPQTVIWTVSAWAFLPLSLFMRGIAMGRVAAMILDMRRRGTVPETAVLPV
jgi:hypothetical protein